MRCFCAMDAPGSATRTPSSNTSKSPNEIRAAMYHVLRISPAFAKREVVRLLGLDNYPGTVTVLSNVHSKSKGKKDVIKIEKEKESNS